MKKNDRTNAITSASLAQLREDVMAALSPKRFRHVAAVEDMVARLCALYCPEEEPILRTAALLHDITKEWTVEAHCDFFAAHGLPVTVEDRLAHKTLHARTAALLIPERFPQFNDPRILSAVRWHTTGRADMTLPEKLLYLADYIDLSRKFKDCVLLRRFFFGADPEQMNPAERATLLRDTLILSYDMTIAGLCEEGLPIAEDTVRARNELLTEHAEEETKKG